MPVPWPATCHSQSNGSTQPACAHLVQEGGALQHAHPQPACGLDAGQRASLVRQPASPAASVAAQLVGIAKAREHSRGQRSREAAQPTFTAAVVAGGRDAGRGGGRGGITAVTERQRRQRQAGSAELWRPSPVDNSVCRAAPMSGEARNEAQGLGPQE